MSPLTSISSNLTDTQTFLKTESENCSLTNSSEDLVINCEPSVNKFYPKLKKKSQLSDARKIKSHISLNTDSEISISKHLKVEKIKNLTGKRNNSNNSTTAISQIS